MKRVNRILRRMPDHYKTWDKTSVIYNFLLAFGWRLEEAQRDLFRIMRSHWVDTAFGRDLDKLASIFMLKRRPGETDSAFRRRIKRAILDYKGGGTVATILSAVRTLLELPEDYPIEIIENPLQSFREEFEVRTGDSWVMSSRGIEDSVPKIKLEVLGPRVVNPTILNLTTGESVGFKGVLKENDVLEFSEDGLYLNGLDVTDKLVGSKKFILYRRKCEIRYYEELEKKIGVFDQALFDESIFAIGISKVRLIFTWEAKLPATFKLRLPKRVVERQGVSLDEIYNVVNFVKAAGVRAIIELKEGGEYG